MLIEWVHRPIACISHSIFSFICGFLRGASFVLFVELASAIWSYCTVVVYYLCEYTNSTTDLNCSTRAVSQFYLLAVLRRTRDWLILHSLTILYFPSTHFDVFDARSLQIFFIRWISSFARFCCCAFILSSWFLLSLLAFLRIFLFSYILSSARGTEKRNFSFDEFIDSCREDISPDMLGECAPRAARAVLSKTCALCPWTCIQKCVFVRHLLHTGNRSDLLYWFAFCAVWRL